MISAFWLICSLFRLSRRHQALVYQLNSSGKYFAFKEQLKYAVVKIVREKYLKTVKFQDSDELKVIIIQKSSFFIHTHVIHCITSDVTEEII